jgi:threonine dehydratase
VNKENYLELIKTADVYSVAKVSPLDHVELISEHLENKIFLKREDLQKTFSFKIRGAVNKLKQLQKDSVSKGVICSSAGNHAQGVALAAKLAKQHAVIVMPQTTPSIKIEAVKSLGAEIIIHGDNYDEAFLKAKELEKNQSLTFIHPFDDPYVIAGQGTIGVEILEQIDGDIDAIFIPIGGGGLISGIATYVKETKPNIKIIGVEPEDSSSMKLSLEANKPITLDHVGIFADGVAVKRVGDIPFKLCKKYVDEIITVTTDETCAAIQAIYEQTRSIVEPSGALSLAGITKYISYHKNKNKTYVGINCGANVNFDRLRHIAERAAVGKQSEILLAVEIEEKPGSFKKFCDALGKRNITEFNYRYHNKASARVFLGLALHQEEHAHHEIINYLEKLNYSVMDLSQNEMAKVHIRHMVGGRASIKNEQLFRFEFPERPGALLGFLNAVGNEWNITLFHYRNHGSDFGRILTGIEATSTQMRKLEKHLSKLGYRYWKENSNPAYGMFLA